LSENDFDGPAPSTAEMQLERSHRELKMLSNRQVELFDRLRHLEERFDALLDRIGKFEDRITTQVRKPTALR
jgi:hypothetical protein